MSTSAVIGFQVLPSRANLGDGKLTGTLIDKDGNSKNEKVWIYEQRFSGDTIGKHPLADFVEVTRPDPQSGQWVVKHLSPARRYMAVSHDSSGQFDPVLKTNLRPEPME